MKLNFFERIIYFLQAEMTRPKAFGWFHLMWITLAIITIYLLYKIKPKNQSKQLKIVLAIYAFIALSLEIIKQIIWSFNYNPITNITTWDYQWYAFPFQLCTTPIFVSLICLFLKPGKLSQTLLSYLAFITILGSITTIIMPDSCFVETIEVNIHTMFLHIGSFVISIYLLITEKVKLTIKNLINSIFVFLIFVILANILNILIYQSQVLNGEVFNMFYISPYFPSTLPVFDIVYTNVPYIIFLVFYLSVITLGAIIVYSLSFLIKTLISKKNKLIKATN